MQTLPIDVEQALQHAIGQANSAFTPVSCIDIDQEGAQRKKGRKRASDDGSREGEQTKKKRQKKHNHPGGIIVEPVIAQSNIDPSLLGPGAVLGVERKGKKNKKRKDPKDRSFHCPGSADLKFDLPALLDCPSTSASPNYLEPALLQQQSLQSSSLGLDYPFQLNTDDDILRVFQDLDLTRLAGVLRSLDLPPSSSQSNLDLNSTDNLFESLLGPDEHPYDEDMFSSTANAAATAPSTAESVSSAQPDRAHASAGHSTLTKRPVKPSQPALNQNPNLAAIGPSIANPEHTQLLATKWLSPAKLKELEETEGALDLSYMLPTSDTSVGLVFKKGKFSALEDQALNTSIENYRVVRIYLE